MTKTKTFKSKPGNPVWEREANKVARLYAPPIYTCCRCMYPVVEGYICMYCGCTCEGIVDCTCEEEKE